MEVHVLPCAFPLQTVISGDRVFKEEVKLKWGCEDEPYSITDVLKRKLGYRQTETTV